MNGRNPSPFFDHVLNKNLHYFRSTDSQYLRDWNSFLFLVKKQNTSENIMVLDTWIYHVRLNKNNYLELKPKLQNTDKQKPNSAVINHGWT